MFKFKSYHFIRILSLVALIAMLWAYWGAGALFTFFMLAPYLIVCLLANAKAYSTTLRILCRATCGILISVSAIALLFGIQSDAQAGIGFMFGIIMQYGVLFVSEAIIGLATYEDNGE